MNITLSINNFGDSLVLPVLPSEIAMNTGLKNETFDVVSLGEIGIIGNRKLNTVTISSFFPEQHSSYCQYNNPPKPREAVAKIEKWRDSRNPIRFTLSQQVVEKESHLSDGYFINMACMIEEFSYREKGGQPGDIYYDLSLKEYRFIQAREVKEVMGSLIADTTARPDDRQLPPTHTVKPGESLFIIAKLYYQDGNRWSELYDKNKDQIEDPDLIYPGQVLLI